MTVTNNTVVRPDPYKEGCDAYFEHKTENDNPYPYHSDDWSKWRSGFYDIQEAPDYPW